jgi:hypothetical protein
MRYLSLVLKLSPVIAAAASYAINLLAAKGVGSAEQYAHYLQVQAWAVYFGAVSSLCLVDLKQSPYGHRYKGFSLLGVSLCGAAAMTIVALFIALLFNSLLVFTIAVTGFTYAAFRSLLLAGLVAKIPRIAISLRLLRAALLLILGAAVLFISSQLADALDFVAVQAVAAAIPFVLFSPRLFRICCKSLIPTLHLAWKLDKKRLVRRNLSYWVDMSHTPLFYMSLAGVHAYLELAQSIYLIGLLLPLSFLCNEIIGEQCRVRFGLSDLAGIISKMTRYHLIMQRCTVGLSIAYIMLGGGLLVAIRQSSGFEWVIVAAVFFQIALSVCASIFGLVISKAGAEVPDLLLNITVLLLLSLALVTPIEAPVALILCSMIVGLKYLAQQLIAHIMCSKSLLQQKQQKLDNMSLLKEKA